jgi:hypothetical protein
MTKHVSRRPIPCVLGLDIGTTSTIGILIRPLGGTLAIEPRREAAPTYRRACRRYRDLYRRLAERSELPAS